jgi:hypothetical protein
LHDTFPPIKNEKIKPSCYRPIPLIHQSKEAHRKSSVANGAFSMGLRVIDTICGPTHHIYIE